MEIGHMSDGKVTNTRWGDILEYEDKICYPTEHPYVVCHDAVFKAGNLLECLKWRHQCELVYKCVELDHLPREQRVNELAVHVIAMGIHGGWAKDYFAVTDEFHELISDGKYPPQEAADHATMWLEAEALAAEWKSNERLDRKEKKKKAEENSKRLDELDSEPFEDSDDE